MASGVIIMDLTLHILAVSLFFAILILTQVGRAISRRQKASSHPNLGIIDAAVFGLLGLLVAFTFSGAASRFDARRQLIIQEVNAIGTAYLRLSLLPSQAQAELRDDFRQYVQARAAIYRKLPDAEAAEIELARSKTLQDAIWDKGVRASRSADAPQAALLLLPALNEMIDITTTRLVALQTQGPLIVLGLLSAVALAAALLVGHAIAVTPAHGWLHVLIFAAVLTATVYVIVDLEYPRAGLIRIQAVEQLLADLLRNMK
jgi:hypothetical protein